jgi:hypothetical protein
MKKRFLATIGIAVSAAMLLTACGGGNKSTSYSGYSNYAATESCAEASGSAYYDDYNYDYGYAEEATVADYDDFGTTSGSSSGSQADSVTDSASVSDKTKVDNNRKLIKTVDLDVETKEFDSLITTLDSQVELFGGYVESQNTWNGSRYDYYGNYQSYSARNASYTIRIPRENLSAFIDTFSPLCNVTNRSESVQDITLSYVDLESHKQALLTEEQTLNELMSRATEMEDILTIEDKLTDIRYQLQSMESQLRTYDNKVTYSTVYIDIKEVKELTIEEPEPETYWDRMRSNFTDSMETLFERLQDFSIWFVAALPHLLIWGAIIFGIVMLVRGIIVHNIKKARKRREEDIKNGLAQPQPIYYAQPYYGPVPTQQTTAQTQQVTVNTQAVAKTDATKADDKKEEKKDK